MTQGMSAAFSRQPEARYKPTEVVEQASLETRLTPEQMDRVRAYNEGQEVMPSDQPSRHYSRAKAYYAQLEQREAALLNDIYGN